MREQLSAVTAACHISMDKETEKWGDAHAQVAFSLYSLLTRF